MSREEFLQLAKGINSIWKEAIPSQDSFDLWFMALQDIPYEIARGAVEKCVISMTYAPKPADIRNFAYELKAKPSQQLTAQEAFGYIERAVGKSTYYAKEAYDSLPELLKRCTSPEHLHALATDENYNSGVELSHFTRIYNELLRKEQEYEKLTPNLKQLVSNVTASISIEDKTHTRAEELQKALDDLNKMKKGNPTKKTCIGCPKISSDKCGKVVYSGSLTGGSYKKIPDGRCYG